jgi:mRNA interferase MazF
VSRSRPGEVWFVDLDPSIGHEKGGRRPAVVVGSALHCSFPIDMVLVAPCTSVDRALAHHVPIDWRAAGLRRPTFVRTEDVRALSERRLIGDRPVGLVNASDIARIKHLLRMMFDL